MLAPKAFVGNPYDRHTLAATQDQATSVPGAAAERIYADKGYHGHDYTGAGDAMITGRRRGLSASRELRRRSAIGATIGHMKTDGKLDRNFLLGQASDAINARSPPPGIICASCSPRWPFGLPSSRPPSQRPSQMRILPPVFSRPNRQ